MRRLAITTVLLLVPIVPLGSPAAGMSKLVLLEDVQVRKAVVTLEDLLPAQAPSDLRTRAATMVIGTAPAPACVHVISGEEINQVLQSTPEVRARLELPPEIRVHRYGRALAPAEVAAAINGALWQRGGLSAGSIEPAGLKIANVYVTQDDPGLHVDRIATDPLRKQTRFLLRATREPSLLPFWVAARYEIEAASPKVPVLVAAHEIEAGHVTKSGDLAVEMQDAPGGDRRGQSPAVADFVGLQARLTVKSGQAVARSMFEPQVLVEAGTPVKLVLEQPGFRITTSVIPLQRGVLGQRIRVRDPETKRVLAAEVVGPAELRSTW